MTGGIAQTGSPVSVGSLAQLTLSLVLIIGLIFALSWAVKRFKLAAPRGRASRRGGFTVLDELVVGPRERIMLVAVGDAQLLVGVGTGGMVSLNPLAVPIEIPKDVAAAPAFADRLRELMKRPGGAA
jgi:flagellar protein FliO/FliZ